MLSGGGGVPVALQVMGVVAPEAWAWTVAVPGVVEVTNGAVTSPLALVGKVKVLPWVPNAPPPLRMENVMGTCAMGTPARVALSLNRVGKD